MNVLTKTGLRKIGFRGFHKICQLQTKGLPGDSNLLKCGVYAIVAPRNYKVSFLPLNTVKSSHNVLSPWTISRLKNKWVEDVETLYIGLAGFKRPRSLKKRLRDLIRHSLGKTTPKGPHKGGEIIWQLANYQTFEIGYMPTGNPPAPKRQEEHLIKLFIRETGKMPFANRR